MNVLLMICKDKESEAFKLLLLVVTSARSCTISNFNLNYFCDIRNTLTKQNLQADEP
jgi:uncharacterized membrane protein YwzB